jgi:hypothetical protein
MFVALAASLPASLLLFLPPYPQAPLHNPLTHLSTLAKPYSSQAPPHSPSSPTCWSLAGSGFLGKQAAAGARLAGKPDCRVRCQVGGPGMRANRQGRPAAQGEGGEERSSAAEGVHCPAVVQLSRGTREWLLATCESAAVQSLGTAWLVAQAECRVCSMTRRVVKTKSITSCPRVNPTSAVNHKSASSRPLSGKISKLSR